MNKGLILSVIIVLLVAGGIFFLSQDSKQLATESPTPTVSTAEDSGLPLASGTLSPSPASTSLVRTPTPTTVFSPRATASAPQTHTIRFTANGVSSLNLHIRVGDTVTFINDDSQAHWPASGNHPTHLLCPGFDAMKGLTTGQTYSFKFTQIKTCPFHDHLDLSAQYRGTIIVQ